MINFDQETIFKLLGLIISIITLIYLVRRFYIDTFNKKEIQDFEQINKYFLSDKIKIFDNEPLLIQEMLCNTVSYFKDTPFSQVKEVLENRNVGIYDFINLKKLRKIGYLTTSNERNKNYKNQGGFLWVLVLIFVIYIFALPFILEYYKVELVAYEFFLLALVFIGLPEIYILSKIDRKSQNKKVIAWYAENEDRLKLSKIVLIGQDSNFENINPTRRN
ncbi:hypothetical protein C8D76_11523 [Pasteurella langaaensis DSM 22999]|uniref:Uncharacterized protein n=1 Tax=Alitibacter langaaensis DSM 22999 TaxID=1122935 RepID=A0A2U0SLC0_9PAST|nr:hypothetical protein [Pasteurella langaaensis]PVX32120.1 hypothetical protein C8D76_11523 [Pasteurella langaaensis DSM 22999]